MSVTYAADVPHAFFVGAYAGFWKRFLAYLIDFVIVFVGTFAVSIVVLLALQGPESGSEIVAWLFVIVPFLYHAVMESSPVQATVGKLALGIRVCDLQGRRVRFDAVLGRNFAKLFSALGVGYGFLMAGFSERKQALHDKMAGGLVVNRRA